MPASTEVQHRFAFSVAELGEQLIQLIVEEELLVVLDLLEQIAHHLTSILHLLFVELLVPVLVTAVRVRVALDLHLITLGLLSVL